MLAPMLAPMLAKIGDESVLDSREHIFEPKIDGFRAIWNGRKFISRNGRVLESVIEGLPPDMVLDGELIVYDERGLPSFQLMQQGGDSTYVVFDILEEKGKDLRSLPLMERKKRLESLQARERFQVSPYTEDGRRIFQLIKDKGGEGVIAKRKDSRYREGRSSAWLKVKLFKTADCVILGYKRKIREIGSLELGVYDNGELLHVGNVGTGFTEAFLAALKPRLDQGEVLVCEIKFQEFTRDRKLRAPVFLRLREDKEPRECTLEQFS